ncbi:MAG: DegV family protein [Clostridiaceae bacterium]
MGIKIVTDSTSYIPKELLDKFNISVASLNVMFKSDSYKEVDIDNNWFYKKMDKENCIPTSSQPSVTEFINIFEEGVSQGNEVLGIFITSKMSGTFQTANLAKNIILETYKDANIVLIESNSNSMELGFSVLEAARAAYRGESFESVIERTKENINKTRFVFAPDTLKYLEKGGRIGKASSLIGSVLKIRPILTVKKGEVIVKDKVRTTKKAVKRIVEIFIEDIEKYDYVDAIIHHINCEEEAKKIKQYIFEVTGKNVLIGSIGPVIGLHVGPGAIGMAYITKEKIER